MEVEGPRTPAPTPEGVFASLGRIPGGEPEADRVVDQVYQAHSVCADMREHMRRGKWTEEYRKVVNGALDRLLGYVKEMAVDVVRLQVANRSLQAVAADTGLESEVRALRREFTRLVETGSTLGAPAAVSVEPRVPPPAPGPRRPAMSYASAVSAGAAGSGVAGVVIVEPLDPNSGPATADAVKERLVESLDPVKDGFQVVGVRRRGRAIELRTATDEGTKNVLGCRERLAEAGLKVKEGGRRNPRLILYSVPRTTSGPDAMVALRSQNFRGVSGFEGEWCKLEHYAGPKKDVGRTRHIVFSVKPALRDAILRKGHLAVGWEHCRVDDYIGVSRCGKCLLFGHRTATCKRALACAHCAEEGHMETDCPSSGRPKVCAVCKSLGKPADHALRSYDCPAYQRMHRRQVEMTNY